MSRQVVVRKFHLHMRNSIAITCSFMYDRGIQNGSNRRILRQEDNAGVFYTIWYWLVKSEFNRFKKP